MIGGPGHLGTVGDRRGSGSPYGRGDQVAALGHRKARAPEIVLAPPTTRGTLDKEIIRRVVRSHLNEIRFCYEQSLLRRPSLSGRVVVQFTIAPTGRVLVSALQSSTIAEPALSSCVVEATRRWEYPRPDRGGLVSVSYPFQLTPAGG
jgi:TonB family protein